MTKKSAPRPLPLPASDLAKEKNLAIATEYHKTGDPRLLDQLVKNHMVMVTKMARSYGRYDVDLDDLVSEGYQAVIIAARNFDPAKTNGASFATYAASFIHGAFKTFVMRNDSIVAVTPPNDTKRVYFRARFERSRLAAANGGTLPHNYQETIAATLNVPVAAVKSVEPRLLRDVPGSAPFSDNDDSPSLQDTFASDDPTPEDIVTDHQERDYLRTLLDKLSPRERQIIVERVLAPDPPSFVALAEKYGMTPQGVHLLESRTVKKLKGMSSAQIASKALPAAKGAGPD